MEYNLYMVKLQSILIGLYDWVGSNSNIFNVLQQHFYNKTLFNPQNPNHFSFFICDG